MRWLLCLFLPCVALSVDFTGEAIYWRPAESGFDYAFLEPSARSRQVFTLEPNYDWGFAASGRAGSGLCDVQVGGLYVDSQVHAQVSARLLILAALTAARAIAAELSVRYWMIDARAVLPLFCPANGMLEWIAGGRYVNLRRRSRVRDFPFNGFDGVQLARFRGAGPELGLLGTFNLWRNVSVTGSLLIEALIGRRSLDQSIRSLGVTRFDLIPASTVVVPGVEARLGFCLHRQNYYFWWRAEIGYQQDHYWNAFTLLRGTAFVTRNRSVASFGYAGPYGSFTLGF